MSNTLAREEFRRRSVVSDVCRRRSSAWGRWLSSRPGGDAVDHRDEEDRLVERCAALEIDALLVTKLANAAT